jgi:asparagine synthase (glutamine-hydrolysing)
VDFAMRLPVRLKLANLGEVVRLDENEPGRKSTKYYRRTADGKLVLRRAMERNIPASIAEGVKQGFSGPDASWFKGESIQYVRRTLLARTARVYEYLDYDAVARLVTEHLEGNENRRLLIWSLLNFENWLKLFLHSAEPGSAARAGHSAFSPVDR